MAKVELKQPVVNEIKELLTDAQSAVLVSKFLGSIQSPITNFARVIKQIAEKDGEGAAAE